MEKNGKCEGNEKDVEKEEHSEQNLLSLMKSWDVETFLEQPELKVCEYYKTSGSCPYQEVGCMFIHDSVSGDDDDDDDSEEEPEKEVKNGTDSTHLHYKERLSARSRNRKVNEERFRRLRDLSISCP